MTALDEAAAALAANDMARVEAIAGEILKTQPAHPVALHLLAAALSAQGRVAEALAAYQSAVEWLHGNLALTQVPFGLHVLQRQGFRPKGILDIGAFEGAFARTARHFFAQSPILMLEAQPGKEVQLKAIAAQLPDVDYRIVLLGAENRADVAFHHVNAAINSSGSSLYDEQTSYPRDTISLPMRRLDDVLAEMPGREFDLCRADACGRRGHRYRAVAAGVQQGRAADRGNEEMAWRTGLCAVRRVSAITHSGGCVAAGGRGFPAPRIQPVAQGAVLLSR
jgi:FkbM family methyltransferase